MTSCKAFIRATYVLSSLDSAIAPRQMCVLFTIYAIYLDYLLHTTYLFTTVSKF